MKRTNEGVLTFKEWVDLWKKADRDIIRLGLLHSVMNTVKSKTNVITLNGDEYSWRFRFMLLIADERSGYSEVVRVKAFQVLSPSLCNCAWEQGADSYRLHALLWYLRPDKTDIWPVNRNTIGIVYRGDRGKSLFEALFGRELPEDWCKSTMVYSKRQTLLKIMASFSPNNTAIYLRNWLFEKPMGYNNALRSQVDFKRLHQKLLQIDSLVMLTLTENVVKRFGSFKTALFNGDQLAQLIQSIDSIRFAVEKECKREQLERQLSLLNQ